MILNRFTTGIKSLSIKQLPQKAVLTILLSLSLGFCFAQRPLTNSRQSSYYTYIYQIKAADVLNFYKYPNKTPDDKILQNPIDSFKTDGDAFWVNHLPAGNYLKVYAERNELRYQLIENHSADLKLMLNGYDLRFTFMDKGGNLVENAAVTVNSGQVFFDPKTKLYRTRYNKKDSILRVDYAGVSNFFSIKPNITNYYSYQKKNWLQKLWASVTGKTEKRDSYYRPRVNPPYSGFMVFNKPKYKPNDTVKFKAFIVKKGSKQPLKIPRLLVRLKRNQDDNGTILGYVNSYRDGGYEYSFVLNDSLKLTLDDQYDISLEDPSSVKYDLDKYKGDDDDKFLAKRKVYQAGQFYYEDYELKSIHFEMRVAEEEHRPGQSLTVYLKATDENDLPVADGRVNLTLVTTSIEQYKTQHLFLPDTIWTHQMPLDPVGETKLVIPDSIFPKASFYFNINADFLNAANEHKFDSKYEFNNADQSGINLKFSHDTLLANYLDYGKKGTEPAIISAVDKNGDTISRVKAALPYRALINPAMANYNVQTESVNKTIYLGQQESGLALQGYRTADSLFITVKNDRKLHFWYTVFDGNKLIDEGQADSLFYKRAYNSPRIATFVINYIWAGEGSKQDAAINYSDKVLTINVKQPASVYPGQQVRTDIVVTDINGKPVPNTDVTAWSVTRKFDDYRAPYVPYLGHGYRARTIKKPFAIIKLANEGSMALNWAKWSREIGLDSIAYYQFAHPKPIYTIEEPANDTLTQIAPFIVKNGNIQPVHILYIDERPVYFSQAQQLQRYSFHVQPGVHSLRFRTVDQIITLDSVIVAPSKKLILSLDADAAQNKFITEKTVSDTLNYYEADLINKYLITVINNFGDKKAELQRNGLTLLLNPKGVNYAGPPSILAGPLPDNYAIFKLQGQQDRWFLTEPGYSYLFEPGLLKQKSLAVRYPFSRQLKNITGTDDYRQYVLTENETIALWQDYLDMRSNTQSLFINKPITTRVYGRLTVSLSDGNDKAAPFIKNIIIYRYDNPDYIRIYPGNTFDFGQVEPGKYRLLFLLKNDAYDIKDSINIKPYGVNHYRLGIKPTHSRDSVSIKINTVIENRPGYYKEGDNDIENDALLLKEAFNEKYYNSTNFSSIISGIVISSDDKKPIPGAFIRVKGTNTVTQTGIDGKFHIKASGTGKLIASSVGYLTAEFKIQPGEINEVLLSPSKNQLNEVVVIGYGTQLRKDVTGSVSSVSSSGDLYLMQGRSGAALNISIRGISSLGNAQPIYIVDGVQVTDMNTIDVNDIGSISVLKDAGATAIYGAAGANGVIVISTKKKAAAIQAAAEASGLQSSEQSIRKNFSDYAYWQPKLTTNENGIASFTSTFPDDITNWRTFIIAINGQKQSGNAENQIKSFKPLSAAFISPLFAVQGDELSAIGKVMNYNPEPARLTRTFAYNGKQLKQDIIDVKNSKIDTLNVTAGNTDSLTFEYSIKRDNGYFDGERRKIPVIKQGVKETKGVFAALNADTTVMMQFDPALGPITFRAESSVLPGLAEEAKHLREYKYLCNEQLASKLKGLLAEKRIMTYLGEPFKYEKNIREVIKKLQENRRSQGTWGWWKDTDEELWISLHAVEALTDAQNEGYAIDIDLPKLTDYLVYQLESYRGDDKLTCLRLLLKLKAKVNYSKYFAVINNEFAAEKWVSEYDKLGLMLLQEQAGMPVKLDSLFAKEHHTLFGNVYWGEDNYRFFDNSVQLSVLAYKILKAEGKYPALLEKIRGYFLEQRRTGEWRNTYESSLILETILPELLKDGKIIKPASLTITGERSETVTTFPYTATLGGQKVTVSKIGSLQVYVTGYQQFWNPTPQKVSKDFTVDTWFEKKGDKISLLKGGEPVQLKAEITAKGDADFVMIEIPIPAGCSYESKEQSWVNNEVHREYFKEKVSIFCRKMKEGKYEFTINLIPRYDGKYNLNPAKAEMMYFPVFYGREGMKKIVIGSVAH